MASVLNKPSLDFSPNQADLKVFMGPFCFTDGNQGIHGKPAFFFVNHFIHYFRSLENENFRLRV